MSSTGVRELNDDNKRVIKGLILNEAQFIQSLRVFANTSTLSGLGATGTETNNSPLEASGNYLAKSGDIMIGQLGNAFDTIAATNIVNGILDVSKATGTTFPIVILQGESPPAADDLVTITQGEDVFSFQELVIRTRSSIITVKNSDNVNTPDGNDLVLPVGSIIHLYFDTFLGEWVIDSGTPFFSSGGGGEFFGPWTANHDAGNKQLLNLALLEITDSLGGSHGTLIGLGPTVDAVRLTLTAGEKFQIFDDITPLVDIDTASGVVLNNLDLTMSTGNIIAGGAGKGLTNVGLVSFVDNLATPTGITLYSDGIDIFTTVALNLNDKNLNAVNNIFFTLAGQSIIADPIGLLISAPTGDVIDFSVDGSKFVISETLIDAQVNIQAAGAGEGVTNVGHIDFIDNLATPAAAVSLYSDGVDLFANTGGGVVNFSDIGDGVFLDSTFRVIGSGDQSKQLAFEVDTFTTATTRTFGWPDANGTVFITPAQEDLNLNTFDIFNIDQLTFMVTPGTLSAANVGFGALGNFGIRANVVDIGIFEWTKENFLLMSLTTTGNTISLNISGITASEINLSENSTGKVGTILQGTTTLQYTTTGTQHEFLVGVESIVQINNNGIAMQGANFILTPQIGFSILGNFIEDDVSGMRYISVPGDQHLFGDGTNIFATLDVDGLFLNQLFIQFTSIVSPGPTGSPNVGELFMNSANSDHLSIIRNGSVIDLETTADVSQWATFAAVDDIDADGNNIINVVDIISQINSDKKITMGANTLLIRSNDDIDIKRSLGGITAFGIIAQIPHLELEDDKTIFNAHNIFLNFGTDFIQFLSPVSGASLELPLGSGFISLFNDSDTDEISVKKFNGDVISLEKISFIGFVADAFLDMDGLAINMNQGTINTVAEIQFDTTITQTPLATGISFNGVEGQFNYHISSIGFRHVFRAAGEFLASIEQLDTDSGLLTIDHIQVGDSGEDSTALGMFSRNGDDVTILTSNGLKNLKDIGAGGASNVISQLDSSVTVTDTGSDGLINFVADGILQGSIRDSLGWIFNNKILLGTVLSETIGGIGGVARDWNPDTTNLRGMGSTSLAWSFITSQRLNLINAGVQTGILLANADGIEINASVAGDFVEIKTQGSNRAQFKAETDGGIIFFEPLEMNDEITMDGGNMIHAHDTIQCGFAVTDEVTSPGTEGTMQMPRTSDTTPTAAELDADFGSALGCFGLATLGGLPSTPLFVIKVDTSPSTWRGFLMFPSGNITGIEFT